MIFKTNFLFKVKNEVILSTYQWAVGSGFFADSLH